MSVFTTVDREALVRWLQPLGVGNLLALQPIAAGMQNSNYFVTTEGGEWVLTLYDGISESELAYYLPLMTHLAAQGLPCPRPCPFPEALWRPLAAKPAALFNRLPGQGVDRPDSRQCREIGRTLARLHVSGKQFSLRSVHPRGAGWRQQMAEALLPRLPAAERYLLADELAYQATIEEENLPQGLIHADLFRDNVLWQGDRLSGVLDFYFAGEGPLLFDLAVTANDWAPSPDLLESLLAGYTRERPLNDDERVAWPAMRRAAALRFWLSRLQDLYHPRSGEMVTVKDPGHFRDMLESLR